MKIRHVEIPVDEVWPILSGTQKNIIRPFVPRPVTFDNNYLIFGTDMNSSKVYLEDYQCPFGNPGELLMFFCDGNHDHVIETKVIDVEVKHFTNLSIAEAAMNGRESINDLIDHWDEIYGETINASRFNPLVWIVRWN